MVRNGSSDLTIPCSMHSLLLSLIIDSVLEFIASDIIQLRREIRSRSSPRIGSSASQINMNAIYHRHTKQGSSQNLMGMREWGISRAKAKSMGYIAFFYSILRPLF